MGNLHGCPDRLGSFFMSHDNMHAASARVARAVYRDDPQEEADARRALAVAKIESVVKRSLVASPPLSGADIERINRSLRGDQS